MLCELWLSQRYLKKNGGKKIISLTGLISIIGITIGVMVMIVVIAVMSGFDNYLQDKLVGTNSPVTMEFSPAYKPSADLQARLKKLPHIQAVSPYIAGQAFMRIGSRIIGLEMRGIDPVSQPAVSKIKEYMKRGSFDVRGPELLIGEELALRLGLRVGDVIGLVSPSSLSVVDFKVKGIFNSGMYMIDSGLVLTSIPGAQEFFKMGNSVSGLGIKVDDIYKVGEVKQSIYRGVEYNGLYEVMTWIDTNRNFLNALKLEKIVMFIVVTMTTVVAAFGIVSTLIMSVMSKVKDIGILRAVGAKAKSVMMVFIFQGLMIGVTGIILGLLGGISLAMSLNKIIDLISRLIGRSLIPKDIYYFDRIPTNFNAADIGLIVFCALVISLLASMYPAYYASRINPCEAIRHE
ncbi:MAG: FtsX-like permease family protein [Candidatus Omnitrophota bacterium]|jgi:lipoprotein-releasing system permease protein